MPWHVAKSAACPASRPWAVIKDSDGSIAGCHSSKAGASNQMAALYAQEGDSMSFKSGFIAPFEEIEWRQAGNAHDYTFTGRAVVYDSWSEEMWTPMGTFRERILPGAFTNVLATNPDVRLLFNHDDRYVLARTKAGTLELSEEANGLHVWARVAPTSYAKDLRMVMARGDVDQMSFAFDMDEERGAKDRWYEDEESDEIRRDIISVSGLYDVSPVTFPAYTDTTAAMRELRSAVEAGKIQLPTAASDEMGEETDLDSARAETDPVVAETRDASAQDDPVVGGSALDELRKHSQEASNDAHERHLRIKKEIAK